MLGGVDISIMLYGRVGAIVYDDGESTSTNFAEVVAGTIFCAIKAAATSRDAGDGGASTPLAERSSVGVDS